MLNTVFLRLFFNGVGLLVCIGGGKYLAEDFVLFVRDVTVLDFVDSLRLLLILDLGVATVFYGLGGMIIGYANTVAARLDGPLLAVGYGGVTAFLRYLAQEDWPLWYEAAIVVTIVAGMIAGVETGRRLYVSAHSNG